MRKALLATLMLALGAGNVSAQALQLRGSDTLFTYTTDLIDRCVPDITAAELIYRGGGSTLGETEMETGNQAISPMSRFIDSGSCTGSHTVQCTTDGIDNNSNGTVDEAGELCAGAAPRGGQGCKIALDGLGVFADAAETNGCNTIRYAGSMNVQDLNSSVGLDDGAATPVAVPATYDFTDWRDVLRIVYAGQHAHKMADACSEFAPSRSPVADKRCNSDVRRTLVAAWGNLFQEGAACQGADPDACVELKHAFRRDDVSGTTDVLLELLALPAIANVPFCNGAEMQDEDPVRRDCAEDMTQPANTAGTNGYEQVCNTVALSSLGTSANGFQSTFGTNMNPGWRGGATTNPANAESADLGLVLPIVIPPVNAYQDAVACSALAIGGTFRFAGMPLGGLSSAQLRCPDGNSRVGGQCQWPARSDGAGGFRFGCVNKKGNVPGARTTINMDGRVYNLIARNQNGSIQTVPRVDALDIAGGQPEYQVELHHAFYRIHTTAVMPGGVPDTGSTGCRLPDATEQIGCLVHASPCSIGAAGLAAGLINPNKALTMRTPASCTTDGIDNNSNGVTDEALEPCAIVPPEQTFIRRLNDPTSTTPGACAASGDFDLRYPFARALWMNAIGGFETATSTAGTFGNISNARRQQDLMKCACDRFFTDASVTAAGFVTLDATVCASAGLGGACSTPIRTCP